MCMNKNVRHPTAQGYFAKHLSVCLSQNPDTSNASWVAAILNWARFYKRKPFGNCVEPADRRPHFFSRRVHHATYKNPRHS